ncbi:MAG: acyl-CoA dehydrogenase family protein [Candidatus Stahlbacteria bacterium]|nr:acyl-CoA dehydrogenase family protein [Candidatus Stahlbacteria bacterium]
MNLTAEQKLVEDMVRKFTKTDLQPIASELDKTASFPHNVIKKLSDLGFMGIMVPETYIGAALDALSYSIIIEELSKSLASIGLILAAHNGLVVHSILKYGNEKQKTNLLPRLSSGEAIGAFCLTEEHSGYDFTKIETKAEKLNNDYILHGEKHFVVNAETAALFIVFARIGDSLSAFLIEKGTDGLEVSNREEVLGMRASGICNLRLNGVKVGVENVLGNEGDGLRIAEEAISFANLGIASLAVGICQASFDDSLRYSKERHQFGHPICDFQLVQEMLVKMKIGVTQSRLLVRNTASKYDTGDDTQLDIAMAKLCATNSAMQSAIKAIQVHGGYGYTKDYPVERYFRDAKVSQVWGGTSIDHKLKIAQKLLD